MVGLERKQPGPSTFSPPKSLQPNTLPTQNFSYFLYPIFHLIFTLTKHSLIKQSLLNTGNFAGKIYLKVQLVCKTLMNV